MLQQVFFYFEKAVFFNFHRKLFHLHLKWFESEQISRHPFPVTADAQNLQMKVCYLFVEMEIHVDLYKTGKSGVIEVLSLVYCLGFNTMTESDFACADVPLSLGELL